MRSAPKLAMLGLLALLLPLVLCGLAGSDAFDRGLQRYREGKFEEALAAFDDAVRDRGDHASAELHYDVALAALQAGELARAESAAERASERAAQQGSDARRQEFAALRDFVNGNVAFARSGAALLKSRLPDPGFQELDRAIAQAEIARSSWQLAAMSRDDWPQARRNVERALKRIGELRARKQEAERGAREPIPLPIPPPPDAPPPPPDPAEAPKEVDVPVAIEPELDELVPEQLAGLHEKLDAKEKAKATLRRAERRRRSIDVEKDW